MTYCILLGNKLVTRMKRPMTHSSLENVASLSSAARDDASGRGNGVRVEADLTGSAKDGGEV